MAYTKQTWATGDTVTATKLNHMEDGIADGGGSTASIFAHVTGLGSSVDFGTFWYVEEQNGAWQRVIETDSFYIPTNGWTYSFQAPLPPEDTGLKLVLVDYNGVWSNFDFTTISGGISDTTMSVYVGSSEYTAREITGNGYMEIASI